MAGPIMESTIELDGVAVFVRRTEGDGIPVVFSHGNPTHSAEWVPFLERLRRPGIAFDLPGFGRSSAPRGLDYSMHGMARFFGRVVAALGVEHFALVTHDWGGLALIDAISNPERVESLVIVDSVPLLPGYRWHWIARYFWRVPVLGELFNLGVSRAAVKLVTRGSNATPGPMPPEFVDLIWEGWRRGPRWPMLTLYRSGAPDALAAAGAGLGELRCPALVVWGARDPYIPVRFGRMYAERLPNAQLIELPDAGHWSWIDRPDAIDRILAFLDGG